ncbi:hypothetical protein QES_3609 [Clostridioides difficile CD149]|nr:hypothetical protein [Clostridioides difficile]EHJ29092.1 hypothetical protein HMPREF1122_02450 [Clostridioides difficile 002-P50-2011]EHJ29206.1 hypothetical protein HMPREF1123_01884 [Clostridioides difficile 050-P50-2011]EHJ39016.1 hypothetical protein HMPREF9945_01422 [Clostridioides difficile 70-100-2010]EQE01103.1 hypothetical protein QAO_3452 [Clostridioides difficile CD3]EQE03815.1 hypothetical protein QAS_3583 [Clostridioides difficile CD9]EQE14272.1 hypothetical protein QAW_3612 [
MEIKKAEEWHCKMPTSAFGKTKGHRQALLSMTRKSILSIGK